MSAVAIIRYLLANHAPLISGIPIAATKIRAGILPIGTVPPAIGITSISSVRRNTVAMSEPKTLVTERVQVSLLVHDSDHGNLDDYADLTTGMRLIRQACPNQRGSINSVDVSAILPDVEGPDLEGDAAGIISRSQDFLILWTEAR